MSLPAKNSSNKIIIPFFFCVFIFSFLSRVEASCGTVSSSFTTSQSVICGPASTVINFTNASTGAGAGGATYKWYLNGALFDNTTGLAAPATSTISAIGTYNYMLIAFDASVPCKDTSIVTVLIRPIPNALFTFTPNNQCGGSTILFTNSSTGIGAFTTYSWDFGDGGSSAAKSPTYAYTTGGSFNVTLTVTNGAGCSSTISNAVTALTIPSPSISGDDGDGDTKYCLSAIDTTSKDVVTFFNTTTGAVSYSWDFGDGSPVFNTASTASFTHPYTSYATFTVTMTAKGANGCPAPATLIVVFDKSVSASFVVSLPDFSGCLPHTIIPTNASQNADNYVWDFGDGTPTITTTSFTAPSHTYTAKGNYTISLIASNSCNTSTSSVGTIVVVGPPVINFTASPSLGCSPQTVTFGNTTTGATPSTNYNWNFGNGNTLSGVKLPPSQVYYQGIWTVKLISGNACGTDSVSQIIVVDTIPTAIMTANPLLGCTPLSVATTNNSIGGNLNYEWYIDGVLTYTLTTIPNQTFTALPGNTATMDSIRLRVINHCGIADTTVTTLVHPAVATTISPAASTICQGIPVTFTQTSFGDMLTYNWNFGNGNTSASPAPPAQTYTTTGTYKVKLTVTGFCGTAVDSTTVTVTSGVVALFTPSNDTVCSNTAIVFSNNSTGATNYAWDFGDGTSSTITSPTYTYASPNKYTVQLIASTLFGCADTTQSLIVLDTVPTAAFTNTTECLGSATQFTNSSTGSIISYQWDFGDGSPTSPSINPSHSFPAVANYNVMLTVTNAIGCKDSITNVVVVNPIPVASFTNTAVCSGQITSFTDQTSGAPINWIWDFGDATAVDNSQNPTHIYSTTGNFNVTLISFGGSGCSDTIIQTITVNPVPTANFTAVSACANDTVYFHDTSLGSPDTFVWNFDDGSSDNTNNTSPKHVYTTGGTYSVTLTAGYTLTGCSNSITIPITVYPRTIPDFTSTSPCLNVVTAFSDLTTNAPTQWTWNFGDGSALNVTQNPTYIYAASATYSVTLTTQNTFGCKDSITKNIVVNPLPVAAFIFDTVCANTATSFTDQSTAATSWNWDFGDATPTDISTSPTHIYSAAATYTVTLIATNGFGCSDTISHSIIVNPNPVSAFTNSTACHTYPTVFIDNSTAATTWAWDFGDASAIDNTQSPTHIFANAGTYTVSLTVKNSFGCANSSSQSVTVLPQPIADFSFSTVCARQTGQFTDNTIDPAIVNWNWNFGDGGTSTLQNPSHIFILGGSYNVTLIATNSSGCIDTVIKPIIVNTIPTPLFTANTSCLGGVTSFIDQSIDTVAINKWFWDFNDGNNSVSQNPDYIYKNGGTYNVSFTVTNINGCDSAVVLPVNVNPFPNAVSSFSTSAACYTYPTVFTDNSTSATSWSWNFGDATAINTVQSPTHIFPNPGNYNVSLTVKNVFGCSDSSSQIITVSPKPIADYRYGKLCAQQISQFNDSTSGSGLTNWNWDFGDGGSSTLQHPTHTFALSGNYNVTLIAKNSSGCSDTVVKSIFVNTIPNPMFTATVSCLGVAASFTDQSTDVVAINNWFYSFDDGNNSVSQNPNYIYAAAGTYNVSLKVTNINGCSNTTVVPITINVIPVANYTVDTICFGTPTTFTDISTGNPTSWHWDFGDGNSDNIGPVTTHIYATAGSYVSTLSVSGGNGCSNAAFKIVVVKGDVHAGIAAKNSACINEAVKMNDNSTIAAGTIASGSWNFGDGSPSANTLNTTHTYSSAGTYIITHVVSSNGNCSNTALDTVVVNTNPTANFTSTNTCLMQPSIFTDGSLGAPTVWHWNFGDGKKDSIQNPTHTYATAGNFNTTLIATTAAGCPDTTTNLLTVYAKPNASFTSNTVCWGDSTKFVNTSTSTAGTITGSSWDFGDSTNSTLYSPAHILAIKNNTFNVRLAIVTNFGCVDTLIKNVTTYPLPVFNYAPQKTSGCDAFTTSFNDISTVIGGSIVNWLWDFGDGNLSFGRNPTHTYNAPGTYYPSITLTNTYGCQIKDTLKYPVVVEPTPVAGFTISTYKTTILETEISISDNSLGATIWDYDFGDNETSINQNPRHTFLPDTGTFIITQIAINQFGCTDTIQHPISILPITTTYIPNAFTPDDNGVNDTFLPKFFGVVEFTMLVFDRWGNQIFTTNDINKGWDGRVNGAGEIVQRDVYVYTIVTKDIFRNNHRYTGSVTLVR